MKALVDGDGRKAAGGAVAARGALVAARGGGERHCSREDRRRFRLADGEPVREGIVRIAGGQLEMAIERVEGDSGEELGSAVHEARKSFKRLRTALRLARDELGDELYRRENTVFRDAGRRLAGARDSQVLLETLAAVSERYPDAAPPARFARFRRSLAGQHASAQRRLRDDAARADVVSELRQAGGRLAEWPLYRDGLDSLAPGFRRIYRRGRRAYRAARRDASSDNLHELRKRAKDLWYAAQILRPASPKRMKRLAREAHELSTLIGEHHDLAILEERADERRDRFDGQATVGELADLIQRRRHELQREALKIGQRLDRRNRASWRGRSTTRAPAPERRRRPLGARRMRQDRADRPGDVGARSRSAPKEATSPSPTRAT